MLPKPCNDDTKPCNDANNSFSDFKILIVHIADGNGIATEVHDKLAVFQYAHHVAYLSCHNPGQHTEFHVVLGELHKRITQKGDTVWLCRHHLHEWLHHAVLDGSRLSIHTIIDKMVTREIILEKRSQLMCFSLQKHKTANSRLFFLLHAFAIWLALINYCAVDKTFWLEVAIQLDIFKCFLKLFGCKMLDKEVAPRRSLYFSTGYTLYFSDRFIISPNDVDALW